MKLLLDMNLSPEWVPVLKAAGHDAVHWREIGDPKAPDATLMQWARDHEHVVFTHDLDFTALLYQTSARKPSVIQIRGSEVRPSKIAAVVIAALAEFESELASGALASLDLRRSRIILLPLKSE